MKLLYISEFIGRRSRGAAFAQRSGSLAHQLSVLGFTIKLATTECSSRLQDEEGITCLLPNGHSHPSGGQIRRRLFNSLPIAQSFSRVLRRERPDGLIISFHDPQFGLLLTLLGRLNGRPTIFDAQDSWLVLEHEHQGAIRNRLRRMLEHAAMRFSTHVTTVSPTLRNLLVHEYRLPPGKVHVVLNGANPVSISPSDQQDIDLIHLGSPRRYYNTLGLIDAIDRLRASKLTPSLVFLGCTDEPYVQSVKKKVVELRLGKQIRFEPPVPPEQVPGWLARSKIGVHTLCDEPIYRCSIGVKLFEYLASGLPVAHMGPTNGDTAQLVRSTGCGVTASSVSEFASALKTILTDPAQLRALAAGAQAVAGEHTWHVSAQAIATFLADPTGT